MTDANSNATTNTYNAANLLTGTTDPLSRSASYSYDAANNRTGYTDAKSQSFTYAFDALNRMTSITAPDDTISFSYDAAGNQTQAANGAVTYNFTYNAGNLMTQKQLVQGSITKNINYTYDANNNKATMVDAESVTTTYSYDVMNRLTTVANGNYTNSASYTLDAASRLTGKTLFNGVTVTDTYDNANRLTEVLNQVPGTPATTISSWTYAYDAAGNRSSVTDKSSVATSYTYDNINQLTQEAVSGGTTTSWTYDGVGSRATQVRGGTTLTYTNDAANQLNSFTDGTITTTFGYDYNGNTTSQAVGGGSTTYYAYDSLNRLKTLTVGSNVTSFTYGPDDLRISLTTPSSVVTNYLIDHTNVLGEYNSTWTLQNKNTFGLQPDDLLARLVGSSSYHFTGNALGSSTDLTDSSQTVQQSYAYDAWGNITASSGSVNNSFKFTGREDDGTGLYYFRGRYYNPAAGRFLTQDTNPGDPQNPRSQHRYIYGQNRPVLFTDPTGHSIQYGSPGQSPPGDPTSPPALPDPTLPSTTNPASQDNPITDSCDQSVEGNSEVKNKETTVDDDNNQLQQDQESLTRNQNQIAALQKDMDSLQAQIDTQRKQDEAIKAKLQATIAAAANQLAGAEKKLDKTDQGMEKISKELNAIAAVYDYKSLDHMPQAVAAKFQSLDNQNWAATAVERQEGAEVNADRDQLRNDQANLDLVNDDLDGTTRGSSSLAGEQATLDDDTDSLKQLKDDDAQLQDTIDGDKATLSQDQADLNSLKSNLKSTCQQTQNKVALIDGASDIIAGMIVVGLADAALQGVQMLRNPKRAFSVPELLLSSGFGAFFPAWTSLGARALGGYTTAYGPQALQNLWMAAGAFTVAGTNDYYQNNGIQHPFMDAFSALGGWSERTLLSPLEQAGWPGVAFQEGVTYGFEKALEKQFEQH